jgi:hypothetical protein
MTPVEQFDRAIAGAIQDRKNLVRFLNGISDTQAQWQPPDGEWSILAGLEHIMLTEELFRSRLLDILHSAETSGKWDNASSNPVKMSADALRRREQGFVPAPDDLIPSGKGDFSTLRAALIADREALCEALRPYRDRDLSRLVFSHPVYGERNLYDVIEYAGIHDALHCEQMERVTRHPTYPVK